MDLAVSELKAEWRSRQRVTGAVYRDNDYLRRIFLDAVKRSSVRRRITPHDIGRAAATHLHLSGTPLERLQYILGHCSMELTRLHILEYEIEINGSHSFVDMVGASP
jgi:integrase